MDVTDSTQMGKATNGDARDNIDAADASVFRTHVQRVQAHDEMSTAATVAVPL